MFFFSVVWSVKQYLFVAPMCRNETLSSVGREKGVGIWLDAGRFGWLIVFFFLYCMFVRNDDDFFPDIFPSFRSIEIFFSRASAQTTPHITRFGYIEKRLIASLYFLKPFPKVFLMSHFRIYTTHSSCLQCVNLGNAVSHLSYPSAGNMVSSLWWLISVKLSALLLISQYEWLCQVVTEPNRVPEDCK